MRKILSIIANWIWGNKLIFLLIIIVFLILGYPLFRFGIEKSFFYSLDPDVVYITNALLYTKSAIVDYADHPGTPTIMLISYLFVPLRLITKYILHQGFIQWSFDNYTFLTYYVRTFELVLAMVAFFVYLKVIKKISGSNWLVFLAGLCVFSFGDLISAVRVVPENFSLLLTAIWLLFFLKFTKERRYIVNELLVFIAAFAVANKFTSLFLLIPSLLLPIFMSNLVFGQKFIRIVLNILIAVFAFYIGILPALIRLPWIKNWAISLFSHPGRYGTGMATVFDWPSYFVSVQALINSSMPLAIFLGFTLILGITLVVKKKIKISDPFVFLITTSFFGIAVFAKYPVMRYNYVNVLLIVFCTAYLLSKTKISLTKILLPIMIVVFLMSSFRYLSDASNRLGKDQTETVRSVLIEWTPYWSDDVFREQLNASDSLKP